MTPRPQPSATAREAFFLREAIALAVANAALEKQGGGPFGALVARSFTTAPEPASPGASLDAQPLESLIVARGSNSVTRHCDPTAHAEVMALREAGRRLGTHDLSGHVLYSSCEPCPMCLAAALWARVDAVIFASGRDDAAAAGFDDAVFYREVGLPHDARQMPCRQSLRDEGQAAFDAWLRNPDRIAY